MMSVLTLVGLALAAIVLIAVVAVVVWLNWRPESSTTSRPETTRTTEAAEPAPEPEEPDQFEVRELEEGPHPRPRELDRESRRELLLLDERLHREFFQRSQMSPAEWARIADDLLIVHDRMPVGILVERFERATSTEVNAPSQTDRSPREIAAMLNDRLSDERRLELLGTLHEPVEADVYGPAKHDMPA